MDLKSTWTDLNIGTHLSKINPLSSRSRKSTVTDSDWNLNLNSNSLNDNNNNNNNNNTKDYTAHKILIQRLLVYPTKVTIFTLSLVSFCYAVRARIAYNNLHSLTLALDGGHPAWPERMALGEHNALLGTITTAWVLALLLGFHSLVLDDAVLVLAFTFTMPYVWGYDMFRTGVFSVGDPEVQSTLRAWVCLMSEKVGGGGVNMPYGDMCSKLVSRILPSVF